MDPDTYTPSNLAAEARAKFEGFAHSAVAAPPGSREWQPPGATLTPPPFPSSPPGGSSRTAGTDDAATDDDAEAASPCRTAQDKSFYDNAVGSRRRVKKETSAERGVPQISLPASSASSSNATPAAAEWDRTHPRVLPPSTAATRPRPQQPKRPSRLLDRVGGVRGGPKAGGASTAAVPAGRASTSSLHTAPLLRPHRLSSMPWVAEHTHPDDDEVMLPGVPPFPTDDFRGWLLSIGAGEKEAAEFVEEMQQFASQSLGGCSPAVLVSDDFEFQKTDSAQGMVSGTRSSGAVVLGVKLLWVEGRS